MININLNILNSLSCFSFLVLYRELCSVILGILCYCLLLIVHCILSLEFHSQVIWNKVICTACANHNPVVSSFMTDHQILNKCNTTGGTSGAGTAYHPGVPEFIHRFSAFLIILYVSFLFLMNRTK